MVGWAQAVEEVFQLVRRPRYGGTDMTPERLRFLQRFGLTEESLWTEGTEFHIDSRIGTRWKIVLGKNDYYSYEQPH